MSHHEIHSSDLHENAMILMQCHSQVVTNDNKWLSISAQSTDRKMNADLAPELHLK